MLTPSETKTLKFIQKYCIEKGCSPTLTEIADGIGIKSRGVIHRYLKSLESKKLLSILSNRKSGCLLYTSAAADEG